MLPKNWTEDEGALTPTFFSKEVWYNAGRETSAWGGRQGQGSSGGSAPASGELLYFLQHGAAAMHLTASSLLSRERGEAHLA